MTTEEITATQKRLKEKQGLMEVYAGNNIDHIDYLVKYRDRYKEIVVTIGYDGNKEITLHNRCFMSFINQVYMGDIIYANDLYVDIRYENYESGAMENLEIPLSHIKYIHSYEVYPNFNELYPWYIKATGCADPLKAYYDAKNAEVGKVYTYAELKKMWANKDDVRLVFAPEDLFEYKRDVNYFSKEKEICFTHKEDGSEFKLAFEDENFKAKICHISVSKKVKFGKEKKLASILKIAESYIRSEGQYTHIEVEVKEEWKIKTCFAMHYMPFKDGCLDNGYVRLKHRIQPLS